MVIITQLLIDKGILVQISLISIDDNNFSTLMELLCNK